MKIIKLGKITAINFFRKKTLKIGHYIERYLISILFIWFGLLKMVGEESASSIIGKSVYWWNPQVVVPLLGAWEFVMGVFLLPKKLIKIAIILFFIRLPGTFLALVYHFDECFEKSIFIPTIQGQYLLKELTIVGAALVIASSFPASNLTAKK